MSNNPKCKAIAQLLELLHLQSIVENRLGAHGFSHAALGTQIERLSAEQLHWNEARQELTYEYTVPSTLPHHLSLSPLLAVMDDVTSWSALLGDLQRKRFGVSVHLRAEWASSSNETTTSSSRRWVPGQELLLRTRNRKLGRNLAFMDVQIQDANSQQLVAFGSHIKYLDLGTLLNSALSPIGWPLLQTLVTRMESSPTATRWIQRLLPYDTAVSPSESTTPLFDSLQFLQDNNRHNNPQQAIFTPQSRHASLGGPLHGGCQACLLELIGNHTMQKQNPATTTLQSMQVDYLSTPSRTGPVQLLAEADQEEPIFQLRAQISSRGRISSLANLTYSKAVL